MGLGGELQTDMKGKKSKAQRGREYTSILEPIPTGFTAQTQGVRSHRRREIYKERKRQNKRNRKRIREKERELEKQKENKRDRKIIREIERE